MKNIQVLPTAKPSRLYLHADNELQLRTNIIRTSEDYLGSNQHIYITNSEEIKEGDWVFNFEYIYIVQYDSKKHDSKFWYKKIILTTDQELIKDGVQPIDDKFLEWFVKNPSCEEVEVVEELNMNGKNGLDRARFIYKIIIPKEEPKQETLEDITLEEVFGSEYCQFSVVENKLAILYRNQEQLLKAIKLLSNEK